MASSDQTSRFWTIVIVVACALCVLIALPDSMKTWAPSYLKPSLHLGLDLAGGTQLDFRISEDEINAREEELKVEIERMKQEGKNTEVQRLQFELQSTQQQHQNLVEAIRNVLERRINSLGVSEATITPSYFGDEKHLLVECPGIIDVNRCIQTVGKTIQLEFKEEADDDNGEYEKKIRAQVDKVYRSVTSGTGSLQVYGQDLSSQLGVSYFDERPLFISQLPKGLEGVANRTPNDPVVRNEAVIQTTGLDQNGQTVVQEVKGIYLTKVLEAKKPVPRPLTDPKEAYAELAKTLTNARTDSKNAVDTSSVLAQLQPVIAAMDIGSQRTVKMDDTTTGILYLGGRTDGTEQMAASHILIQYAGAERAETSVTRTKEQAAALAQDIDARIKGGADFNTIARTESDSPSKAQAGSIGVIARGVMPPSFEETAFALKKGQISGVVETAFGYHIIRADEAASTTPPKATYELLTATMDEAAANDLIAKVEKGEITRNEDQVVVRTIFFSLQPTGWKDTELNGQRFRTASVTTDPYTNVPVVQIQFDEKGGQMFQELTKRNVGKQIAIFVGGELVSAPNVQGEISGGTAIITGSKDFAEAQQLAQDLNTGAIPAPIYLSGQTTIEATLGADALERSIFAAGVGLIILCLFMILIYRMLGVLATIALLLYVSILVAATKLPILLVSNQHVVLTLAGIAGIILSVGMAVDANVLVFERIKEELKKGKTYKTAIDTGFKKAWPSIRDGNFSTLITCAILFVIGTSIIRGFAVTLTIGLLISLFTAVVITRWLCRRLIDSPMSERPELFGVSKGTTDNQ